MTSCDVRRTEANAGSSPRRRLTQSTSSAFKRAAGLPARRQVMTCSPTRGTWPGPSRRAACWSAVSSPYSRCSLQISPRVLRRIRRVPALFAAPEMAPDRSASCRRRRDCGISRRHTSTAGAHPRTERRCWFGVLERKSPSAYRSSMKTLRGSSDNVRFSKPA